MIQYYTITLLVVWMAVTDLVSSQPSSPSTSSAPSSLSSIQPSIPSYIPFGQSPINWPSAAGIQSASADGNGQLWVTSLNSTRYVYATWAQSELTGFKDLYANAPISANRPIARLVRAVNPSSDNPVLYIEDIANSWIAIVSSFDGQWYRTLNISGFRTYQVSSNGGRLAVGRGNSQGSHYIDYIEMWDTAVNGGILYRVNLHGIQATTGYSITQDLQFLYIPIGMNNSVNQYRLSDGMYYGSHVVQIPDFHVEAVAVVDQGTIAMMDCRRAKVHFQGQSSSTYNLASFNMSMCSESLSTLGPNKFAVLDGERFTYFAQGYPSSSSSSAPSSSLSASSPSSQLSSSSLFPIVPEAPFVVDDDTSMSSLSSSEIVGIAIGVLALIVSVFLTIVFCCRLQKETSVDVSVNTASRSDVPSPLSTVVYREFSAGEMSQSSNTV